MGSEEQMAEAAADTPPTCWVAGENEYDLLGDGWHDRTVDGRCDIGIRTSFPEGATMTPPELAASGSMGFLMSAPVTQLGGLVRVEARLTGLLPDCMDEAARAEYPDDRCQYVLVRWLLRNDLFVWRDFTWFFDYPLREPELVFTTTPQFIPHDHLENGDYRPMGFSLAAARIY